MKKNSINYDLTKFFVHHVGGRNGSTPFPHLPKFSEDITHILYDADGSCLKHAESKWQGRSLETKPYCLADKNGKAKFRINFDPFSSSLFPLNEKFQNYYGVHGGISDYVFEYAMKTQNIVDVETVTLDHLVESNEVPPADFLSIDTEGAELLILRGCERMLKRHTVAVYVEISFVELRKGTSLFGELDAFLRSHKFLLAEIVPFYFGYKRIPEIFRGKGIPILGEALYLLQPDAAENEDKNELSNRLEKLAFASIAFGFTELASEAIERSRRTAQTMDHPRLYKRFLDEFLAELKRDTSLPPLWHETLTFEENIQQTLLNGMEGKPFYSRMLIHFKRNPKAFPKLFLNRILNRIIGRLKRVKQFAEATIYSILPDSVGLSPFEIFLKKYGFEKGISAHGLKKARWSGCWAVTKRFAG